MRPNSINHLFAPISKLSGIGPKLEISFNRLVGNKIVNLIWHLPYNIIKRKKIKNLNNVEINSIVTIKVKILNHKPSFYKKQPYKINCICENTPLDIVFFFARQSYLKSILPKNEERIISGKLEYFKNSYQITHPNYILNVRDGDQIKDVEPVYSLTSGLNNKLLNKCISYILNEIPNLDEWIDNDTIKKFSFNTWKKSILLAHNPKNNDDLLTHNPNRRRLAYDELLAHQLAIAVIRNYNQKLKGLTFSKKSKLVDLLINKLPFKLTNSQIKSWEEISNDLSSPNQMVRLLQGDVGSGKTIVAILAMMQAIDSGYQIALMVPTSILAQQHYENIKKLISIFDIEIIILTGKDKGKKRIEKLELISNGVAKIIIGTHALIQDDVKFKSIGLVIIDEQHRFGVFQRMAFTNKGKKPSILVMSATPIPRTLALAAYGDMDETKITEMPIGRKPVITKSLPINKTNELIDRLYKILNKDEKAYWVCPLIEESEEIDLQAATNRYKILKKKFKNKILLLHGQLKESEKEDIMNKFKFEDYKILVSTTVIEVGIDIQNATTLIIEHAERFGLAQLHQLRGRIGRNNLQSNCVLLYKENIGDSAKKRIQKMKETNDGFEIAEKDLEIRGAGEVLGKKQSGLPSFIIADLSIDRDLLEDVRRNVNLISLTDPKLESNKGKKLRNLLYLFERDIAIKTLIAG